MSHLTPSANPHTMAAERRHRRRSVTIEVVGTPIPGGNKTKMRWAMVEGADLPNAAGERNRCKSWKALVHEAALRAMGDSPPLDGPLELEMCFRLVRPRGHYRKDGVTLTKSAPLYPDVKPDLTKILRSTEDALDGAAFLNDSRVVRAQQSKDWCAPGERPGVTIIVTELLAAPAPAASSAPMFEGVRSCSKT